MGIKDLLRFMKPYIELIHIKKYGGKRVGIDAYSWLHKGAYSCSMEICLDSSGSKKLRYLNYFMHRINLLQHYKIIPIVVFDGASIPCKAATEQERHRRRQSNRELAMQKLKEGDLNAANEYFQRAVSITPVIAHQLIQILKSESIEYVVAPYEADAQLAYLSSLEAEKGGIAAVITEDSDLLAYGCPATIFKMDRYGNGEEIVLSKVFGAVAIKPSFQFFDKELFMGMCVLAGCDFLPSITGIGIAKAHSFVSKYRNLDRVLSFLKFEKGNLMPEDYCKSFKEALAVFQHARIYDAHRKTIHYLSPPSQDFLDSFGSNLDFLGPEIPASVVTAIAEGNLNPTNMESFNLFPSSAYHSSSNTIQNSQELQKPEATELSEGKRFSFLDSSAILPKEDSVFKERKCIDEALQLKKLISAPENQTTALETKSIEIPLKVDYNPFKIRNQTSSSQQISVITQDESANQPCTPDETHRGKKRRQNQTTPDTDVVSEVIVIEEPCTVSIIQESQESVSSKPEGRGRGKKEKTKKRGRSNVEKKMTILNYFSRV